MPAPPLTRRLPIAVMLIIAVFAPGLSGGFLFDDFPIIVSNPLVHAKDLSIDALIDAGRGYEQSGSTRPLPMVSFALNYAMGDGRPLPFKLTNLALHLLNFLLLAAALGRILTWARPSPALGSTIWPACALALLWAIHPIQVSAVFYVVQRMELMALGFVLASLLCYLHGRDRLLAPQGVNAWPWIAAGYALAAAGAMAKETALLFPLYVLAFELTLGKFQACRALDRRLLNALHACVVAVMALVFLAWLFPRYASDVAYAWRDHGWHERLLTQLRVLPMYLGQMFAPLPNSMGFFYDHIPASRSLVSPPTTAFGGLALAGLATLAVLARTRWPLAALGIGWFFAAHALTSNIIPLEHAYEHRNYFALAGILLCVYGLIPPALLQPRVKRSLFVAFGLIATLLAALTLERSVAWGDPLRLAERMARAQPESMRAANELATLYGALARGDANSAYYARAMAEFERASRLPRSSPLPEQGLLVFSAAASQPADPVWWSSLRQKLATQPTGPEQLRAVQGLVRARLGGMPLDDVQLAECYRALLGRTSLGLGDYAMFLLHAETAIQDKELADSIMAQAIAALRPQAPESLEELARFLDQQGMSRLSQQIRDAAS